MIFAPRLRQLGLAGVVHRLVGFNTESAVTVWPPPPGHYASGLPTQIFLTALSCRRSLTHCLIMGMTTGGFNDLKFPSLLFNLTVTLSSRRSLR